MRNVLCEQRLNRLGELIPPEIEVGDLGINETDGWIFLQKINSCIETPSCLLFEVLLDCFDPS